jgi:hypothetical protein
MSKCLIPACEASTTELYNELRRRGCAVVMIDADDVAQQWRTNQEADNTTEPAPTDAEAHASLRVIQRHLEKTVHENDPCFEWGPASDACDMIARWRKEGDAR